MVCGLRYVHRKNKLNEQLMIRRMRELSSNYDLPKGRVRVFEFDTESLRVSLLMTDSTLKERIKVD